MHLNFDKKNISRFARKKNLVVSAFFLSIVLSSCYNPPHPGYSKTASGIFFKLHCIGEGKRKAQVGDYVYYSLRKCKLDDSLFAEKYDSMIHINEVVKGSFNECLSLLADGDSASFILDSNRLGIKIARILDSGQYEKEQQYISWKNDGEMNELKKLKEYLLKKNIDNRYLTDGIYFIPVKKGKGNIVEIGNTVVVHYKGSFPDSTVFDNTYEKKEPFEFKFGDDDQVLRGIELAICQMRKGEKAKLIIPSQLAFGEMGSSTGIVPPFTTVEYEVEIINLK